MKYRTINEHINHIKDIVENIVENYDSWTEDELAEIAYFFSKRRIYQLW